MHKNNPISLAAMCLALGTVSSIDSHMLKPRPVVPRSRVEASIGTGKRKKRRSGQIKPFSGPSDQNRAKARRKRHKHRGKRLS